MDAVVKHCLTAADLYFTGHYHREINEALKKQMYKPLTDLIASFIMPHHEFLCFVAYYLLNLRIDIGVDDDDIPRIEDCENKKEEYINLKTKIYYEDLHILLTDFCNNHSFDNIKRNNDYTTEINFEGACNIMRYYNFVCDYDAEKELWKLPEMNSSCFHKLEELQKLNITFDTVDGKIDEAYYEKAKNVFNEDNLARHRSFLLACQSNITISVALRLLDNIPNI
jgi:hypothetical protein